MAHIRFKLLYRCSAGLDLQDPVRGPFDFLGNLAGLGGDCLGLE